MESESYLMHAPIFWRHLNENEPYENYIVGLS